MFILVSLRKIAFISLFIFCTSCSKKDVVSFDPDVITAQDFVIDPSTHDTLYRFYMPSGFSPNGDGVNDKYICKGMGIDSTSFDMKILNRVQHLMFESTNLNRGWTGAAQGQGVIAPTGMYNVEISLSDTMKNNHHYDYVINLWK
ncbi:MAG: gliding motility-associated C-terminal domain-containing protein [Bacteroidetes bacterium]|nr:gliding motility-associated C-terminal domain-containing protein [Bacteroidota bacterium]